MKLLIIYGAPAVGKFTVAKEICAITGFKLFHNHLTVDLATAFFEFGSRDFSEYLDRLRMDAFETALKANIKGVVFTYCYVYPFDNPYLEDIIELIGRDGGEVLFVHLVCDDDLLRERILSPSRRNTNKLQTVESLEKFMRRLDFSQDVPFDKNLRIDNSSISPQEAAQMVVSHFGLCAETDSPQAPKE